jgi:5-methylcytosine-specific restriction endonuclease McrBC GTP-binding regulatory subunit McrB
MPLGASSQAKVDEVVLAMNRYGSRNIVALSGVAGTGKTYIGLAAAQHFAGHPLFVRQIQFHQAYAYEDFVEGLRPNSNGGFDPRTGIFSEWNDFALRDSGNKYVLLIEEFTRANIGAVLGELLTYIEYRDRTFETPLSRVRTHVAPNLCLLVTMNPRDQSALELDDAMIRRMRLIDFSPSTDALREMLGQTFVEGPDKPATIESLVKLFDECKRQFPKTYDFDMPFGHAVFYGVTSVNDLRTLWHEQLRYTLRKPRGVDHAFATVIEGLYPWR